LIAGKRPELQIFSPEIRTERLPPVFLKKFISSKKKKRRRKVTPKRYNS